MSLLNRSNQTLNINTFKSGVGINITNVSNTSESTCNVKISSNTSQKTSLADDDILLLEDSGGNVKYITGAHLESHIDTNFWSFATPNIYPKLTSENVLIGTSSNSNSRKLLVNGTAEITGNSYLNTISTGVWNGDRLGKSYVPTDTVYDADLLTAENFGTSLSITDPDTLNIGTGGNSSGVGTTTNIDGYNINIGKLVSNGSPNNSGSVGANEITIQATQYYSGNPKIHITAQSATGVVNTGAEVNITCKKYGSGSDTAKITMVADTEIIMNTGFKINSSGAITAVGSKITNGLIDCGIANNKIVEIDSSTVANNDYAKFTSNGLEGRSYAEVASDIGSSITTVGTIATGTWNGTKIGVAYGGTNLASYTSGDLLYASGSTTLAKLAIGSNNKFLTSNGSNPVWSTLTLTNPLNINGTTINLGNLSGWGSNNQILATNGSDTIEYRTLTAGTNITITNTSSSITIASAEHYWENANTLGVLDIQPVSSVNDIDLDGINLLVIPKTVNVIPSGSLASGKVIQYDSGLGGGNGSMVFGDNGSSASTNWDTGIYAKQFIELKCGTQTVVKYNNTPASVSSATFTVDNFNITLDSNNSYQNISYENNKPLMLLNTASSGTVHSHLVMKRDSSQSDFIILRQNNSDELLFHHENSGDDFVIGKSFEYGNKGAKFKYTDPYTYLYNPEDSSGASSDAGSIMRFHKNGSVVYFNTTSTYLSGSTNYFSFAKSNDQEARITMNGIAQISDEWLDESDPSDIRLKYDIKDYGNATEVINKIKIKSFMKYRIKNFNNDEEGNMLPFKDRLGEARYSIGVIAQELVEIPELSFMVRQSDFNDITPAYIHNWKPIISLLVKSNQEQQEEINTLKTELENIKSILLKNNIS